MKSYIIRECLVGFTVHPPLSERPTDQIYAFTTLGEALAKLRELMEQKDE